MTLHIFLLQEEHLHILHLGDLYKYLGKSPEKDIRITIRYYNNLYKKGYESSKPKYVVTLNFATKKDFYLFILGMETLIKLNGAHTNCEEMINW